MTDSHAELAAGQIRIFELIAHGAPLAETLEAIARLIEGLAEGVLASILLLDEDGVHLRHGAAPSLPEAYVRAIDGTAIGPSVGSCGTAAYLREPAVASKIQSDPRWVNFRELALQHGLQACWSTPIISSVDHRVLGTFACYYREPREPGMWEHTLMETADRLARLAIDRARAERAERQATALRHLAHLANATAHEINNPLTTVIGRLEMLAERLVEGSDERELIDKARAAADRIRDIVARMHHITRIEYLIEPGRELPPILDIRKSSEG